MTWIIVLLIIIAILLVLIFFLIDYRLAAITRLIVRASDLNLAAHERTREEVSEQTRRFPWNS